MATAISSFPEQGQLVSVRSRNRIVNEVAPSTLPTDGLHDALSGGANSDRLRPTRPIERVLRTDNKPSTEPRERVPVNGYFVR